MTRTSIKYALFPGYVTSKVDGDVHFINEQDLANLYGVSMKQCMIVPFPRSLKGEIRWGEMNRLVHELGLQKLRPRYDGNYKLKNA